MPFALVLAIALSVQTPPTSTSKELGKFDVGSFQGTAYLQDYGDSLAVALGIDNPAPVRRIPVEGIQVWLLLADGKAAVLRYRTPSENDTMQPGWSSGGKGGVFTAVHFRFEKGAEPVVVLLKFGKSYRMFQVE